MLDNKPNLAGRFLRGTGGTLVIALVVIPLTGLPLARLWTECVVIMALITLGLAARLTLSTKPISNNEENLLAVRSVSNWSFILAAVFAVVVTYNYLAGYL